MSEKFQAYSQYLLPKQLITSIAGRVASWSGGNRTQQIIDRFVRQYGVDMNEAADPSSASYRTFNDFFTRALRPGARTTADHPLTSPVDGAISQLGSISGNSLFQAKGHTYTIQALLAGNEAAAATFRSGQFVTIYLSPRDYHRIHMPCSGLLTRMDYIPGDLFSVNPTTARNIPGLFARNERVVCYFEAPFGPFVLILVGATIVGSMATAWHGVVNPPRSKSVRQWNYSEESIHLSQGEEMGRFLLGSTVVMLFPQRAGVQFSKDWTAGRQVRLGEPMADLEYR